MKSSLVWAALAAAGLAACGSNAGTGGGAANPESCAEHPLDCPAGQTCSFAEGGAFVCLPSGPGKEGETCAPLVGEATCDDALLCVKKAGATEGTCAKLCDPSLGNQCGEMLCLPVELDGGEQTHACF
jgi:hypothetical protein